MTYLTKRNYDTFMYGARTGARLGRFARRTYYHNKRKAGKLGYASGKTGRRGKQSRFARNVRKVLLQTTEGRYKSRSLDGTTFNHDTLTELKIWDESTLGIFPVQGLTDGERLGDEVYVTGIMCRMVFQIPFDRRNTKFKMWYVPYNSSQGNPSTKTEFMHTVSNNVMVDPIQTDRWRGVKYLGMFKCSSVDQEPAAQDKTVIIKKWIPIFRKVTFQQDGSSLPCSGLTERGSLIVAPYDSINTLTTDTVINNSECAFTLYFKSP